MERSRKATATSAFGSDRREGHDSSAFYDRFPAPDISDDDRVAAKARLADLEQPTSRPIPTSG